MSEFVYPLNGLQNYTAEQAGAFNGTRTSGVWSGEGNLAVTVTGARQLSLSKGLAWFTTDDFWGKVYGNTGPISFNLPTADGVLDRICRLVIRWNKTTNTAAAMLISGELSSTPEAPARNMTDELYDLVLADYLVLHGETQASAARLTDQRLNESLCGLMRDGVTRIPTQTLEAQVTALLSQMQENLKQILEGQIADGSIGIEKLSNDFLLPISKGGTGAGTAGEALVALGGVSITKLWENASPSSSFGAQTVYMALMPYKAVEIVWATYVSDNGGVSRRFTGKYPIIWQTDGSGVGCLATGIYDGNAVERFIKFYSSGIVFDNGAFYNTYGGSSIAREQVLVPLEIYGIKGVT